MTYTDTQLKQALAKMLPETLVAYFEEDDLLDGLFWKRGAKVLDTELLHLCWLVEETLDMLCHWQEFNSFLLLEVLGHARHYDLSSKERFDVTHATWQQRTIALCKVKGVEIV